MAEHGQHVHASHGLPLKQSGDVVTADLDTGGLFDDERVGLVRGLIQHGGETEKLTVAGLIDEDFLMIFVDGCDLHIA